MEMMRVGQVVPVDPAVTLDPLILVIFLCNISYICVRTIMEH